MQKSQLSRLNRLRDEIYKAMLRVEAHKPEAKGSLQEALLHAWHATNEVKDVEEFRLWLQKITPICLEMLSGGEQTEFDSDTRRTPIPKRYKRRNRSRNTMEVTVKHLDQVRFSIQAREHTIICDQPADNGGDNTGMTPPELLLASLASCAAFYAVQYLKTRNLANEGIEVKVTAEKLKPPARLGNFIIQVISPVSLTEEQAQGLTRSVHQCLIHNTLLSPPSITLQLTQPEIVH